MSSFVIDKKNYIKAAGIVAGIKSIHRDFWLYDYKQNRNMTEDDIYNTFVDIYNMNAKSVQEQYNDPEPESDTEEYKDVFVEYKKKATKAFLHNEAKTLLLALSDFFDSVKYQIENEKFHTTVELLFARIIHEVLDATFPHEKGDNWGELSI